ncbi:MAG: FAD-dependent oxidoreductase [Syntrophorhabdales bacterium]|jgi:succinate dehydrogenase/fumarate reductase flavoprotein subunit
MSAIPEIVPIETDVLIIGGGLAGCMAAIKASEYGVKVAIAEKSNTLSSGCAGTGIDHVWGYIPPIHEQMGWTIDDLVEDHVQGVARGFINRDLLYVVASESYARVLDLEKFGINFRYPDSTLPGNFRIVPQFHSVPTTFNFDGRDLKPVLTKEAKKRGVAIYNRVMMVELIVADGQVSGALGVGTNNGKIYSFEAKAVVVSTGRVNRLTRGATGVWGNHRVLASETGDGRAMGLRAGLPIINSEFYTPEGYSIGGFELSLGSPRNTVQPAGSVTGPAGEPIVPRTHFYDWSKLGKEKVDPLESRRAFLEAPPMPPYSRMHREGKGPFYLDLTGGTEEEIRYIEWSISNEGKGSYFLEYLKNQEKFDFRRDKLEWLPNSREMAGTAASGFLVDTNMETEVPNLYAAGDDIGGVPWMCSPGAFTMGWRAGEKAALAAKKQSAFLSAGREKIEPLKKFCSDAASSKEGLYWREVEMAIQNIMDYYSCDVRSEPMLSRGLERLSEIRRNLSFRAENPHELMRCLEVRSVLDNSEMILAASRERKESRSGTRGLGFIRAEYPEQDDKNWLAFLALRLKGKGFEFSKIPIER